MCVYGCVYLCHLRICMSMMISGYACHVHMRVRVCGRHCIYIISTLTHLYTHTHTGV